MHDNRVGHHRRHCADCHRSWTGLAECHCPGCHRHFGSDSAFDMHNESTCRDPATLIDAQDVPG